MNDKLLPQSLEPERVIDARLGAALLGLSIATFRRLDRNGKLPGGIQLSERRRGWRVRDLLHWIAEQAGETDNAA